MPVRRTWTDEQLRAAVAASRTVAGVLERLGLAKSGGSYASVHAHVERLGLAVDHFDGQAWARGRSFPGRNERPIDEYLGRQRKTNSDHLRRRLIRSGLKEARCEACGICEWRGRPAPLELDQRNGRREDNRLENLRILCANCHAQTETYCGRNIGRAS